MCLYRPLTRRVLSGKVPRRRVLGVLGALAATALVRTRAAEADDVYDGPLIDAHAHLKDGVGTDAAGLLALYDGAGSVRGAFLFGEPWSAATAARDLAPDRFVPILAEGYANALHRDSSYTHP